MEKSGNKNLQTIRSVPRAKQVIDKFHAIKYVYDAPGDVRKQAVKDLQKQLAKGAKRNENDKLILQETERLRRISHAIMQSPDKWSEGTQYIINQVFAEK